jgi:hypothetical protein
VSHEVHFGVSLGQFDRDGLRAVGGAVVDQQQLKATGKAPEHGEGLVHRDLQ